MTTHRPVTGPDGDNPIRDEQIRELTCTFCGKPATCIGRYDLDENEPDELGCDECCGHGCEDGVCWHLLDEDGNVCSGVRTRCAAAYNARHAGKEGRR